jgi:hypothetical protein
VQSLVVYSFSAGALKNLNNPKMKKMLMGDIKEGLASTLYRGCVAHLADCVSLQRGRTS